MSISANDMSKFFCPGDIYFDIGAHIGDKAIPIIESQIRTILVEPQPACVEILKQRFASRGSMIDIVQAALGSRPDISKMSINSSSPTISTLSEEWKTGRFKNENWDSEIDVNVLTLDLLISKYGKPRYMKIDVEGYEFEVLKGLSQKVGIISFEFTSEYIKNANLCMKYLNLLGYSRFNVKLGNDEQFVLKDWVDIEALSIWLSESVNQYDMLWGDIYVN